MNAMTLVLLAGAALTAGWALLEWRRRDRIAAALLAIGAVALTALVSFTLTGVVLAGAAATVYHRRARTASIVGRWAARSRRTHGVASTVHVLRHASALALRRTARTVRPSHGDKTRWERARTRATQFAVPLCRTGLLRVWASVEDVILVFGGPRKGKSGYLAGRVIDAPGAVLVTSTRTDLYGLTAGLRAKRGPVYVFNAVGLGDLPTTIHFDPLTGCADPVTAYERATDLLSGAGGATGGDREHWEKQARRVLTALLHAAALGQLSMNDVLRWVANPDTSARQVLSLLRRSASAAAYVPDAEQYLGTNDRTRSSITSTIMPALGWLPHPAACAAASGTTPFDVAQLLADRATVYLLGAEESQVAPLMAALTGHIARQARRVAAKTDFGRLDPPLTLVLDEAALIAPVPLDSWSADMGGRGVTILAAFQSRAQLIARWGKAGAATLLNNAAAVVLFGGTQDRDDLAHWVTLVGERDEAHVTHDHEGRVHSRTTRRVPVLSPTQIAGLPKHRVVVFRHGMPPVLGRAEKAWKRSDVRSHARLERRAARAVLAEAAAVTQSVHVDASVSQSAATRLAQRVIGWVTHRPQRGPVGQPSPTTPTSATTSPISAQSCEVDAHGSAQPTNGTHPVGDRPQS